MTSLCILLQCIVFLITYVIQNTRCIRYVLICVWFRKESNSSWFHCLTRETKSCWRFAVVVDWNFCFVFKCFVESKKIWIYNVVLVWLCNCRWLVLVLPCCPTAVAEETLVLNIPSSGRPLSQNWCLVCMTFSTNYMVQ